MHDIDIGTMQNTYILNTELIQVNVTGYTTEKCLDLMHENGLLLMYSNITNMYGSVSLVYIFSHIY